ncbi:MAG: hypothetical protein L0L69_09395, partial [Propionibacterium sp.]|nr:hypothetical protein [Propionibacterium sp.]
MSGSRVARTDRLTTAWMLAAVLVMALGLGMRGVLPQPLWTMVHVVTLGILSNAILQWSWYFARALLHLPPGERRSGRDNTVRILAFNVALVVLVVGMWGAQVWATILGATLVGLVMAWHGLALLRAARTRLASRFAVVIRYYAAAAAHLVIGATLAGFITVAMFEGGTPSWLLNARDGLTVAHALVGVGGWVGLTMAGTLVTLGPTMLHARLDPAAVQLALGALPVMVVGILGGSTAAVLDWMPGVGVGVLVATLAAAVGIGVPLVRALRARTPSTHPSWSTAAGVLWLLAGAVVVGVNALRVPDAAALRDADLSWLPLVGAGGLLQILVGALSHLMPVVIGGGPSVLRAGIAELERFSVVRLVVRNAALVLLAATMAVTAVAGSGSGTGTQPGSGTGTGIGRDASAMAGAGASAAQEMGALAGPTRTLWWALVLATYVADIALFARSGMVQARARRAQETRADLAAAPESTDASVPTTPADTAHTANTANTAGSTEPEYAAASDTPGPPTARTRPAAVPASPSTTPRSSGTPDTTAPSNTAATTAPSDTTAAAPDNADHSDSTPCTDASTPCTDASTPCPDAS